MSDWDLKRANPRFRWDNSKTILYMKADTPEGTLTTSLSWTTPELAEEHWEQALDSFIERFVKKALTGESPAWEDGQKNQHRRIPTRIGTFYLHTMTGPPTWWLPKFKVERNGFMFGWLRAGFGIGFQRR